MEKSPLVRSTVGIFFVFFLAFSGLLPSCAKKQEQVKKPPVAVITDTVKQKDIPIQVSAIGNVEAYSTIQVKSQAGGELLRVHFKEGQDVSKGALLFTIDPRPYEVMIKQAEANLAKDAAQLQYGRDQARRYEELVKKGYVSKDQYEQFRSSADALSATVNADKANLDNARLQLKYCYIYSPITGRTGNLASNQGNLIKANADSAMVVVNQIQPIYVNFSVPEQSLPDIKKYMTSGKLKIDAYVSKDSKPEEGILTFIDNTVDVTTGTIKLKGTFANQEKKLWPGQFVNIVLTLTTKPNAVLAPSSSVLTGQSGQYVFVVKADNTVEQRPVTSVTAFEGYAVIDKGLAPGETVVTDGQVRLMPGAKVEIKRSTAEKPASPADNK